MVMGMDSLKGLIERVSIVIEENNETTHINEQSAWNTKEIIEVFSRQ
jgi:hypothetical protein